MRLITLTLATLSLVGCGGFSSKNNGAGVEAVSSREISPTRKVMAVVSRTQLLPNYLACTGLPADQVSNGTRNEVQGSLAKMAEEGSVDDISPPMLMSFVKVGAEVCNDLIGYEQDLDARKFFGGFNLGNNRANESFDLGRSVRSLASACWGRQPSSEEVNLVLESASSTAIADREDRNMALYVCTAILASSAAVKF